MFNFYFAVLTFFLSISDLILTQSGQPCPLTESAELSLLESVGLMTAAAFHTQATQAQAQAQSQDAGSSSCVVATSLLTEMLASLSSQVVELAGHPQFDRYRDHLSELAGRKIGSIGALCKGHTLKQSSPLSVSFSALLSSTLATIGPSLITLIKYKNTKARAFILLHRMVSCAGVGVLPLATVFLPTSLQYVTEFADIEAPIQLVNQLMIDFNSGALPIVNNVFSLVLDKMAVLMAMTKAAAAVGGGGGSEGDIVSLQKLYLSLLNNITLFNCTPCLYSPENHPRLATDVLSALLQGVQGQVSGEPISLSPSIPLRRLCITIITSLAKAWFGPVTRTQHPSEVSEFFVSFLLQQVVPAMLQSLCNGSIPNILTDALSQQLVGDVSQLMWTLSAVAHDDFLSYLRNLLLTLQWPETAIATLIGHLDGSTSGQAMNTFRDTFKKFIKQLLS